MRFLSIGECMVELAPLAGQTFGQGFAGDTFNTVWYLAGLRPDVGCSYLTCVGTDALSDRFMTELAARGIDQRAVHRRADRTMGLYMISLQDGERSFSYWRENSAARMLAENAGRLRSAMAPADMVYFSGITLAILGPRSRLRLLDALSEARGRGVRVAFDPNLRPGLWENPEAMRHWVMLGAEASDIVLPSFQDEQVHFGDTDPQATLARYGSVQGVVVKNGGGAIHYRWDEQTGCVTPPQVNIIDTTAAGDSFNAGLFACLDKHMSMEDRLLQASAVAGQVIQSRGALVDLAA
ncbi:sugar kinase [Sagittula sp. SSi028]|uniref:sugar kinase n=1 Tax=Sagittula sp. SSi028 TaxID=3400636 RepID=UPI003AF5525F